MLRLNLDPEFKPFGPGIQFEAKTFTGGEEHPHITVFPTDVVEQDPDNEDATVTVTKNMVRKENSEKNYNPENEEITIVHRVSSSAALMRVLMANDALQRLGFKAVHLYMPYLPYARQDRVINPGEPLAIRVLANLINSCNFKSVTILDPHNDVGTGMLDRCKVIKNYDLVEKALKHFKDVSIREGYDIVVVSPDAGAYKKIYGVCEAVAYRGTLVLCNKVRDLQNGTIKAINFDGDVKGKDCFIVDDICDGGRTFIELGRQLKERGARRVILVVSHGIFSYGEEPLKGVIDVVYTTNSFRDFQGFDIVTCFSL